MDAKLRFAAQFIKSRSTQALTSRVKIHFRLSLGVETRKKQCCCLPRLVKLLVGWIWVLLVTVS